jgi:hypothetical protein
MSAEERGFLSRWSQRKAQVQQGVDVPAEAPVAQGVMEAPVPVAVPVVEPAAPEIAAPAPQDPPPPTMADVAELTTESDYSRFVARNVDNDVRNAALRKLFTDPHFNVMDRLDIYIDDYNKPDPIPASMLKLLTQSPFLGFFPEPPVQPTPDPDENSDLQLQPDDAAGCTGPEASPGDDAGCEPGGPGPRP